MNDCYRVNQLGYPSDLKWRLYYSNQHMTKPYETGIPSWLEAQPESLTELPVETRIQELPFDKLTWENFEQLCLRLVQQESNYEGYSQLYGERGDEQAGIDLYARKHLAQKYTVYQCKRVKKFGKAKITNAVAKFLEGDLVEETETFVLCTSESLGSKQRSDAVLEQRTKLVEKEIELIIWDKPQLSLKLKELPDLVSDFFGDAWVAPFCGQSKANYRGIKPDIKVTTNQYLNWLTKITSYFLVPGLGKELSIETAWVSLKAKKQVSEIYEPPQTIKEELKKYQKNSDRKSNDSDNKEDIISVDNIEEFPSKAVLIGRSGTGKSTILRRLAHFLSLSGKKALLVRLSKVAQYFSNGETFENSLLIEAVDNSGIDLDSLKTIFSDIDYLLADGLDECSSQQASIAQELVKWSQGHSRTKIVLTSRPYGYDSAYLPQWQCLNVLPSEDTKKNARLLLEAIFKDNLIIERELDKFIEQIKENKAASIASQNPLLLGFLLQLSINGIELVKSRASLYESIFNLAYQQSVPNREFTVELDESVAQRILEIMGWHLQANQNITKQDLIKNIGNHLAQELEIQLLSAKQKANEGIKFWEERRIIELFKIRNQEFVTFVHLSLQEYSAGNYVATLNSQDLYNWLQKVRRQPKSREIILFASGADASATKEICKCLIELDNSEDPTSTEALLAIEALLETEQQFPDLAENLVSKLKPRLKSEIPYLVFEAAEKLLSLVPQAQDSIGSLALSTSRNEKFWIRLSGIRLGLECGADYVDLDILTGILNKFGTKPLERDYSSSKIPYSVYPKVDKLSYFGRMGWEFQNQIIPLGVKLLLNSKPDAETDKCIENLKQQGHLSAGTHQAMDKVLMDVSIECLKNRQTLKLIPQAQKLWEETLDIKNFSSKQWLNSCKESENRAKIAFLESILRIGKTNSIAFTQPFIALQIPALARLFSGMEWWEQTITAWDILGNRDDTDAIDTVIAGAIVAMRINIQQLLEEASAALDILETSNQSEKNSSELSEEKRSIFGSPLTRPLVNPCWKLAKDLKLSPENLVRALKHPSDGICHNAVLLLMHGAGGNEAPELIKEMLQEEDDEMILWAISNVAPNICGEETLKIFLDKLNKPLTKGSSYLLKRLPQISEHHNIQDNSRVFSTLISALKTEYPRIATAAGEALSKFEISQIAELGSQIREAFDWWIEQGTWCDKHQITTHKRSCPKCRVVLDRPQSKLVGILTKLELIDTDELISLCVDSKSGVQEEAVDNLVEKASEDKILLISLLEKISVEESLAKILVKILSLPSSVLASVKTELVELSNSDSAIIREIIVKNLSNSNWLDRKEAIAILENALKDDDIPIRDRAIVNLRTLKNCDIQI